MRDFLDDEKQGTENPDWKKTKTDDENEEDTEDSRRGIGEFANRIGRFFSHEPQKEKVLRHKDFHAAGDVYYASVSAGYKVIQRFLWVFFVCFMAISLILNYRVITYDNFFYLQ